MLCAIQDTLCNIEESLWGGFESPPDFSYIADGCPVLFSLSAENRTLRYFGRYTTVMTICWREVITCYPLPCHFFGSSILLSFDLGQWCKIEAKLYRVTLLFDLCQTEKKSCIIYRRHFLFISFICYSVLFNVLSKMVVQFQAWSNRILKSFSYSKL